MKAVVLLFALVACLALPLSALAEVSVEVRKIYATSEKEYVDPKLGDLAQHFNRFGMFTSFELKGSETLNFSSEGQERTLSLPGGKTLKLIYRGTSKGFIKLRFELADLQMNVRIHEGGLFFHSGVQHDKGRVVLAIKAKTTEGAAPK
jgi:hypothetical protein